MATKWSLAGALFLILCTAACAPKRAAAPPPAPPPARQNVFVLLPEPGGESSGIVVRNQAGTQNLIQPYQATRVERSDVPPAAPFTLDQAEVRRLFGTAIDALPAPEVVFLLHFDEGRDVLNAESVAQVPAILNAIRQRHSTAITVTGHTDTIADAQFNYRLGLRRAQNVAEILRSQGVNASDLFVSSHGAADLLVKTAPGVAELRNRRVEVIVR
jgi:outer membrane protein OmpA-like peptidoglycan-associated protein